MEKNNDYNNNTFIKLCVIQNLLRKESSLKTLCK